VVFHQGQYLRPVEPSHDHLGLPVSWDRSVRSVRRPGRDRLYVARHVARIGVSSPLTGPAAQRSGRERRDRLVATAAAALGVHRGADRLGRHLRRLAARMVNLRRGRGSHRRPPLDQPLRYRSGGERPCDQRACLGVPSPFARPALRGASAVTASPAAASHLFRHRCRRSRMDPTFCGPARPGRGGSGGRQAKSARNAVAVTRTRRAGAQEVGRRARAPRWRGVATRYPGQTPRVYGVAAYGFGEFSSRWRRAPALHRGGGGPRLRGGVRYEGMQAPAGQATGG